VVEENRCNSSLFAGLGTLPSMPLPQYCNLPDLGLIGFTGEDAQSFLHNQLTCDVNALGLNQSTYGSYCTPKGRVLATFLLWRTAEGCFMQLPGALREGIQKRLAMYVLRSKVKVADASPHWTATGLSGEGAEAHLGRVFGAAPRSDHEVMATPDTMVIRLPERRYEVLAAARNASETLTALKAGTEPMSPALWDQLDIRAGISTVTPPTQEEFVPQMLNLDLIGGLSFSKGCYPGQEIVARMHFLGSVKQRTYRAHIQTGELPVPGDKLYSEDLGGQASGTIVNAAPSAGGGFDVLAAVQISSAQGATLHWRSPDGPVLRLLPLPYDVPASAG